MTSHGDPEGDGRTPLTDGGRPVDADANVAPTPLKIPHHGLPRIRWIEEIKRRNVGRIGILYLVVCWLVLEPVHVIFHMLEVPVWANRLVIILMALGFPLVMIFAWVYEITPDGLKPTVEVPHGQSIRRQTGRRLDQAIITVLALALAYFVVDKFWISQHVAKGCRARGGAFTPSLRIGSFDCCSPVRRFDGKKGPTVFRGWYGRRGHRPSCQDSGTQGHWAYVIFSI
jgi:hypothetical protein